MKDANKNINSNDLRDISLTVAGAARSGIGVAKLLTSIGARVFVSDSGDESKIKSFIAELDRFNIPYETGKHSERAYEAEIMVVSPGVPSDAEIIVKAKRRGIKVVSELEVAAWFCRAPIIAVTGTNGKTTTTALIGRMLHDAGRSHIVAGNIGDAFSNYSAQLNGNSVAVVEVSSFQLDHVDKFKPNVAIILNVTPDHLDRYENSMDKYIASKSRIFANQNSDDALIYNEDDSIACELASAAKSKTFAFSLERTLEEGAFLEGGELKLNLNGVKIPVARLNETALPGLHNAANALAAMLAVSLFGIPTESLRKTLTTFKGVEHRLEFVHEINGIRFVNDSKATNVESTWHALKSFNVPLVLILGGRDKGNDYSRIDNLVEEKVKAIIAIGESAEIVNNHFNEKVSVIIANSMEDAVEKALKIAKKGDTVLLSPACASFDWFESYEHRGKKFKDSVLKAAKLL